MKITFFHGFHNTDVTVYAKGGELTQRQIAKVEKKLCGMADCSCFLYPIYGITADEATAVLTKEGKLSIYQEVWVEYDIDNLPFITSADFCADSCAVCAAVGGYCGNCDGSYWKANSYSKWEKDYDDPLFVRCSCCGNGNGACGCFCS